ncbi:hypothetical protein [Aureimonas altamirensis]|uniref:hypothetical protein n=1 Tax=Aureimonas altamirensis TaxID=370622 RepID=UPI003EBC2F3E
MKPRTVGAITGGKTLPGTWIEITGDFLTVPMKSQDRLDLQTLHRARSRLVAARKPLENQLRAVLLERGHAFTQGREVLEREIDPFLAGLSGILCGWS